MRHEVAEASFSAWIDAFRWVAAACVLITHTGLRMLSPNPELFARAWRPSAWLHLSYLFLAGFDHQAVMVFFVLSGLLVGGGLLREVLDTGTVAIGRYMTKRVVRICIVLWPALLLVVLCDGLALRWGALASGVLPPNVAAALSLPVLICNAVLLQTAACPQFGGNGPLWSLFNEAWYYLLFPCFALAALAAWPRSHRLALAALGAAVLAGLTGAQFTGSPLAPYMLIWAMGAVAAILKRPVLAEPWQAAAVLAAVLLLIRLAVRRSFAGDHPLLSAGLDVVVSLLFANLLLTMRFCRTLRPPPLARLHHTLAACSFSLYCTHSPVLVVYITALVATAGIGWQMPGDSSLQWLAIGGALILCVGFAYGFAQVTEAHTTVVRRWLTQVGSPRFRPLR